MQKELFWGRHTLLAAMLLMFSAVFAHAQKAPPAIRLWSVGPLTRSAPVMEFTVGKGGINIFRSRADPQTGSSFAAIRSMAFVGDRIILASLVGTKNIPGVKVPGDLYRVVSLARSTGEIENTRDFVAFSELEVFATKDGHAIISGYHVLRLTPDLKDAGQVDDNAVVGVENISPDGTVLGDATRPGFKLIDTRTMKASTLTADPAAETSVNDDGFVTDNVRWSRDYPGENGFITYTDAAGDHLLYHSKCDAGRPQFLTNDLLFARGCKAPMLLDLHGHVVRTLQVRGKFSFAGVSQDGKRMALQLASYSRTGALKRERFVIYSVETGESLAEVTPDVLPEEQSWTAFSPDGSFFAVGSPLHLSLYRLP